VHDVDEAGTFHHVEAVGFPGSGDQIDGVIEGEAGKGVDPTEGGDGGGVRKIPRRPGSGGFLGGGGGEKAADDQDEGQEEGMDWGTEPYLKRAEGRVEGGRGTVPT
jgi:hypothetical protein